MSDLFGDDAPAPDLPEGMFYYPAYFSQKAQEDLLTEIRSRLAQSPLFVPVMPKSGQPMSVRMTNFGDLGWVTDKDMGYRYQALHPQTGKPWVPMPEAFLAVWRELSGHPDLPQAALVNFYEPKAKMGLHQDRDEEDFSAPVLSISLGDDCLFRFGGERRGDPTRSIRLKSGDVLVFGGKSRLIFHGVDRIYPGTSALLKQSGRVNVTLRRVTPSLPAQPASR